MKTVVTFVNERFPLPEAEEPVPEGRDLAIALQESMVDLGLELDLDAPVEGEGGWSIYFATRSRTWRVFLNSAGLGEPVVYYWAISVSPRRRGIVEYLIGPRVEEDDLAEAALALKMALERLGIRELRWWDLAEFTAEVLG